jgi:ribonuclease HI
LWEALSEAGRAHLKIKRTRVKAHSGILLNECADMLGTKGIIAEPMYPGSPQLLVPEWEDTDAYEYPMKDGEEDLDRDWEDRE